VRSPYLDHVGRIVGGLTPTKGKQSLVGSRQEAVYGCRRLLPQFHISLQYTRSHGRSVGRVLLCVTYRRCLGYEIRDPEVVIHYPWVQDFFSTPKEPTVALGPTHLPLGAGCSFFGD
jgi:hypothetical protein